MKYTIGGGCDTKLDIDLVKHYEELTQRGRSRRKREIQTVVVEKENATKDPLPKSRTKRTAVPQENTQKKTKRKTLKTVFRSRNKNKPVKPTRKSLPEEQTGSPASSESSLEIPREIIVKIPPHCKISPLPSQFAKGHCPDESLSHDGNASSTESEATLHDESSPIIRPVAAASKAEAKPSPPGGILRRHLSLEQVYDDERRKAASFVDDVVDGRTKAAAATAKPPPPPAVQERQQAFQTLLQHLLHMNESMIEQDSFLEQINDLSSERREDRMQFNSEEADVYVKGLAQEGKVMSADGMIILI